MSRFRSISILVFLAVFVACAWAQNDATLVGTVTDQSGAAQPHASIDATETTSGRKYTGITDERGAYRIANMQPGTYRVQVTQGGFAPAVELSGGAAGRKRKRDRGAFHRFVILIFDPDLRRLRRFLMRTVQSSLARDHHNI